MARVQYQRVGILTFHRAYNCGAMLQAWAMQEFLRGHGCDVDFPSCNSVGLRPRWIKLHALQNVHGIAWLRLWLSQLLVNLFSLGAEDLTRHAYRRFRRRFLKERKCAPAEFAEHYDRIVVGSDQVWQPLITKEDTALFLAENISANMAVVSYAASFGDSIPAEPALKRIIAALPRFKAISVREELAAMTLQDAGFPAEVVLDPTFLLRSPDYKALDCGRIVSERYLFLYAVSLSSFVLETARKLSSLLRLRLVICAVYVHTRYHTPRECIFGVSPDKMVSLIAHADAVLASSFHGTALSVIFEKPFLSMRDDVDVRPTRVSTLLGKLGLKDRIANPSTSLKEMKSLLSKSPDWPSVSRKLDAMREQSIAYLKGALGL